MLASLKFVQGAVAKKDFAPALTHFHIEGRYIKGYNGMMALCAPVALDLNVSPRANPFVRAIEACKSEIAMHVTPAGKLAIKSGKFKAFIDCTTDPFPEVNPEGTRIELPSSSLLKILKVLNPFIAEDASRPWARGILLRGQSAFATSNVVVIEHLLDVEFPFVVNVPKMAVTELLRIGEEPIAVQVNQNNITFHFTGDRWLRTQLYDLGWPDIDKVLTSRETSPVRVPEGFFDALGDLTHFVGETDGVVFNIDHTVATSSSEGQGASFETEPTGATGVYNLTQLKRLEGVALWFDLTGIPGMFFGERLRGAIMGMRVTI